MTVLAIDPGPKESAFLLWDGSIVSKGFEENSDLLDALRHRFSADCLWAVEMIACYGMPVGREVFETCLVIGRILEIAERRGARCELVLRKDVKLHLCMSPRAKDANVRQALIDRIGAPGTKKNPGPTYGCAKHDWAALAIAVFAADRDGEK